jgi:hypothetical protein
MLILSYSISNETRYNCCSHSYCSLFFSTHVSFCPYSREEMPPVVVTSVTPPPPDSLGLDPNELDQEPTIDTRQASHHS